MILLMSCTGVKVTKVSSDKSWLVDPHSILLLFFVAIFLLGSRKSVIIAKLWTLISGYRFEIAPKSLKNNNYKYQRDSDQFTRDSHTCLWKYPMYQLDLPYDYLILSIIYSFLFCQYLYAEMFSSVFYIFLISYYDWVKFYMTNILFLKMSNYKYFLFIFKIISFYFFKSFSNIFLCCSCLSYFLVKVHPMMSNL